MNRQSVTIAVNNQHLTRFDEIVAASEKLGLQVSQRLPGIGVIIGEIDENQLAALRKLEGIAGVEPAHSFNLPPPQSDIQ